MSVCQSKEYDSYVHLYSLSELYWKLRFCDWKMNSIEPGQTVCMHMLIWIYTNDQRLVFLQQCSIGICCPLEDWSWIPIVPKKSKVTQIKIHVYVQADLIICLMYLSDNTSSQKMDNMHTKCDTHCKNMKTCLLLILILLRVFKNFIFRKGWRIFNENGDLQFSNLALWLTILLVFLRFYLYWHSWSSFIQ